MSENNENYSEEMKGFIEFLRNKNIPLHWSLFSPAVHSLGKPSKIHVAKAPRQVGKSSLIRAMAMYVSSIGKRAIIVSPNESMNNYMKQGIPVEYTKKDNRNERNDKNNLCLIKLMTAEEILRHFEEDTGMFVVGGRVDYIFFDDFDSFHNQFKYSSMFLDLLQNDSHIFLISTPYMACHTMWETMSYFRLLHQSPDSFVKKSYDIGMINEECREKLLENMQDQGDFLRSELFGEWTEK
jgi:hypothetical protein